MLLYDDEILALYKYISEVDIFSTALARPIELPDNLKHKILQVGATITSERRKDKESSI